MRDHFAVLDKSAIRIVGFTSKVYLMSQNIQSAAKEQAVGSQEVTRSLEFLEKEITQINESMRTLNQSLNSIHTVTVGLKDILHEEEASIESAILNNGDSSRDSNADSN